MPYDVKEIFYSIQGEGVHAGRAAVFCRFAGCNLWSGTEQTRASAACRFCDTDFVGTNGTGGGRFGSPDALAELLCACWPREAPEAPFVVCTGGEPLLQLDDALVEALHARGAVVAIETNGTRPIPEGVDWVCVSPKAGAPLVARRGDELKLVYPQAEAAPEAFAQLPFRHFLLQPMDGADRDENTRRALDYCLAHPQWRISLQLHKILKVP